MPVLLVMLMLHMLGELQILQQTQYLQKTTQLDTQS